jgi:hypothetical protein
VKQAQHNNLHVVFLHIPKAAGTTLSTILGRYYNKDKTFDIRGSRLQESLTELAKLSASRRAEIMLLRGHMPFGLHQYLPQPTTYITMLRHPTTRAISGYYYIRTHPRHKLNETINGKNIDIGTYVSSGLTSDTDNGQIRMLTGHIDDVEIGGCTRQMLEQAKANLSNHFAVVGLSEWFDESLILMKRRLGWNRLPLYAKRNVAEHKPPELPESVLNVIRKHNELDQELYEWAAARFRTDLERGGIQKELTRFRVANSLYQSYKRLRRLAQLRPLLINGGRVLARRQR